MMQVSIKPNGGRLVNEMSPLNGYDRLALEATGRTDPQEAKQIVQAMRDYFATRGVLDGLCKAGFKAMARQAEGFLIEEGDIASLRAA